MKKSFFFFKNNWSSNSSKKIVRTIFLILKKKKNVNFFLTGGKTSIKLYKELKKKVFPLLGEYLNFFLTDERYVSKTSKFSNSKLIIDNFFKNYSDNRKFYPIYKSANNNYSIKKKIKDYEKKISSIDIILLSLAEDGHIAGLFPNYYRLNDKRQYFFFKKKKTNFIGYH